MTDQSAQRKTTLNTLDANLMRGVAKEVKAFTAAQIIPLRDEIAALKLEIAELKAGGFRYCGVWQKANGYARGCVVTFDGSMFVAVKDVHPAEAPLTCEGWQLAVKAGRDARDQRETRSHR